MKIEELPVPGEGLHADGGDDPTEAPELLHEDDVGSCPSSSQSS